MELQVQVIVSLKNDRYSFHLPSAFSKGLYHIHVHSFTVLQFRIQPHQLTVRP